jgi:ribosome-associated protein
MAKEENQKFNLCVKAALKKKAFDLIILDINEISSFGDYFIMCSGNSNRQVKAIASSIEHDLKKKGIYPLGIEGFNEGNWILLDYDDIIIHIFYHQIREFYELERLWADAPRVELKDEIREKSKKESLSNLK